MAKTVQQTIGKPVVKAKKLSEAEVELIRRLGNVRTEIVNGELVIHIVLGVEVGNTAGGNVSLATTRGNIAVDLGGGQTAKLGLNLYRVEKRSLF